MKRHFLFALLASAALFSCKKDDDPVKGIVITDGGTSQTVYADDTAGQSSVEFTTAAAWTSQVTSGVATKADADWVSIQPSSGGKGNHQIAISLKDNYTGVDRSATISIIVGDDKEEIVVTQKATREDGQLHEPDPVSVDGVSLDKPELALAVGGSQALAATVAPAEATDKTVTWSSSDEAVATVDEDGVVTAVAEGTATITVTATNGTEDTADDKTATCAVTVTVDDPKDPEDPQEPVAVTGVTLSATSLSLTAGGVAQTLVATVAPADAADKTVTWSSSDNTVAMVASDGKVSGIAEGTATITVTATNGTEDTADDYTATCAVTVAPAEEDDEVPAQVTGVDILDSAIELPLNTSKRLMEVIVPSNATNKNVTWSSSDDAVATVNTAGVVTAVGTDGQEAKIYVTTEDGGKMDSCTVTLITIHVESVVLNKSTLELAKGATETLSAVVAPVNATDKTISWSSDDTGVATVDAATGKVTAVAEGTANIIVTTTDGGKADTCAVAVVVPVTGVALDESTLELAVGGSQTLVATVAPTGATNENVSWSSSNEDVATVDEDGEVTAVAGGTATITVTTEDGGKTATCAVTVVVPVTGVELDASTLELAVGGSQTLVATVAPTGANNKTVTWSSDDEDVATVDAATGKVTAVAKGTATITVTTEDGGKTATCAVTVVVPVTGVELNKSELKLAVGEGNGVKLTETLSAVVAPVNATDKTISWSSDDTGVATVDAATGKVTAVAEGTANIIVTTTDGEKKDTCVVTVVKAVTSVNFKTPSMTLTVGDDPITLTLELLTFDPEDATDKTIVWSLKGGEGEVTLNGNVLTIVKPGQITLVATSKGIDPEAIDDLDPECLITVEAAEPGEPEE